MRADPRTPAMQCKKCGTICNLLACCSDNAAASLPKRRHNAKSIVVVLLVSLLLLRPSTSRRRLLREPAAWCLQSPLCWCPKSVTESSSGQVVRLTCFEIVPSPHSNFAAVEFAFVFQSCLLRLLTSRLTSVAPAEVVKFPERVCR